MVLPLFLCIVETCLSVCRLSILFPLLWCPTSPFVFPTRRWLVISPFPTRALLCLNSWWRWWDILPFPTRLLFFPAGGRRVPEDFLLGGGLSSALKNKAFVNYKYAKLRLHVQCLKLPRHDKTYKLVCN